MPSFPASELWSPRTSVRGGTVFIENQSKVTLVSFQRLIESFGEEKNVKGVESALKMMRGFNVPENEATFGALVTAFAKCNRLDRTEEFLELAGKKKYATAR